MNDQLNRPSRLSVDEYHALIRAGTLTEDDPVELLDGELVTKMPKNPSHRIANRKTRKALEDLTPAGWYVEAQEPITLAESEPAPDVTVVPAQSADSTDHHPGPQDVALVVEVADSSLQRDRTLKKSLYAQANIPAYWIVNLSDKQLEVYTEPSGPADQPDYRQRRDYGPSDTVPVVIGGKAVGHIAVRDLLP
jgi:Uma2 family endonuclease